MSVYKVETGKDSVTCSFEFPDEQNIDGQGVEKVLTKLKEMGYIKALPRKVTFDQITVVNLSITNESTEKVFFKRPEDFPFFDVTKLVEIINQIEGKHSFDRYKYGAGVLCSLLFTYYSSMYACCDIQALFEFAACYTTSLGALLAAVGFGAVAKEAGSHQGAVHDLNKQLATIFSQHPVAQQRNSSPCKNILLVEPGKTVQRTLLMNKSARIEDIVDGWSQYFLPKG